MLVQGKEGKATLPEAYNHTPQGGSTAAPTPPCAKSVREKCPRQDSNLYAVSDTGPSNQPVYQFQHVGKSCPNQTETSKTNARGGTRTLTGLTPTGS